MRIDKMFGGRIACLQATYTSLSELGLTIFSSYRDMSEHVGALQAHHIERNMLAVVKFIGGTFA